MNENASFGVVKTALQMMGFQVEDLGPQPLRQALRDSAGKRGMVLTDTQTDALIHDMMGDDVNAAIRRLFTKYLHQWDYAEAHWATSTARNTLDRRARIYDLLELSPVERERCDQLIPARTLENEPTVIADEHQVWYTPARRAERSFYWDSYVRYLEEAANWKQESLDDLNRASDAVLELISDPFRLAAYQSKGLVVGYVQSGKTANFIGVMAKAADAGYRLIIVLAGTLDILRNQTQRRIDKQLIGKEMIRAYTPPDLLHDYAQDRDWAEFVEYGGLPSERGEFDWHRLTGALSDYRRLGRGLPALEFERKYPDRKLIDPENLHAAAARIVVAKKNASILKKLTADLSALARTPLADLPTLIIDDESDQASIDTTKPDKKSEGQRTSTNKAIVELLQQLPRAQYVGYTATPFANVFVDPNDAADLFPRDFIISLPRPALYMGTSEFFDLEGSPQDSSNEDVYVRRVNGEDEDQKGENLPRALDLFVLAGAIKLYRAASGKLSYPHHTMLVHRSARVADHEEDAALVRRLYRAARYGTAASLTRLAKQFVAEFPVRPAPQGESDVPHPASFEDLGPYLQQCLVMLGDDPVIVVNGTRANEAPDFEKSRVWRILVGGTKLSRGYTVEGLTVSYYRRKARNADTLMQMGRWFGFRRGYRDLVRLFIGVAEPDGSEKFDLLEAFKGICRDEEDFREQLSLYAAERSPRITPRQIPPLVPSHLLRPTAPNKMYNAKLVSQNFGGQWLERTTLPEDEAGARANEDLVAQMLSSAGDLRAQTFDVSDGSRTFKMTANWLRIGNDVLVEMLRKFRFLDPHELEPALEFLEGKMGDPEVEEWLVLAPQVESRAGKWRKFSGLTFSIADRTRRELSRGYKAFSEPRHRAVAEYVTSKKLYQGSGAVEDLKAPKRGVMLLYPCRDVDGGERFTSMGFALLPPLNSIPKKLAFSVRDPRRPEEVVVDS